MLLLRGTLLRLPILTRLSEHEENLQPFATVDFFKIFSIILFLLEKLNLQVLHTRLLHLDVLFHTNIYHGVKCHPLVLETVRFLVPDRNIHNYSMCTYSSSCCATARYALVVNVASKLISISRHTCLNLNKLKWFSFLPIYFVFYVQVFALLLPFCVTSYTVDQQIVKWPWHVFEVIKIMKVQKNWTFHTKIKKWKYTEDSYKTSKCFD
jgi:hypothetical protein